MSSLKYFAGTRNNNADDEDEDLVMALYDEYVYKCHFFDHH